MKRTTMLSVLVVLTPLLAIAQQPKKGVQPRPAAPQAVERPGRVKPDKAEIGATNSTVGRPGKVEAIKPIDKASPNRTIGGEKAEKANGSEKPGGARPLTDGECTRLGGTVLYTRTCGTRMVCRTKDSNGNYHWECITSLE